MKSEKNTFFKKRSLFIALLLLFVSILVPLTQGQVVEILNNSSSVSTLSESKNFCITIHRIKQEDEIDPWPHSWEGEWKLNMYVNGEKQELTCTGEDIKIDEIFTWEDIVVEGMKSVDIKMELLELDTGVWPDFHDIADISAYEDEDYQDKDYDDTTDFDSLRPTVFKRCYNLVTEEWEPVDENNDFLKDDDQSVLDWYITSGSFDGSTTTDENDVSIWFNIAVGNTPPYSPEKPVGTTLGWIGEVYAFDTKSYDLDGDYIQFGWDWNGDYVIDELTDYCESWQTIRVLHSWHIAHVYYIRAIAIDSKGMASEWSDPLKVVINGPEGKSGFEIEEWSMGHVYSVYYDHYQTQEILNILRSGGNIVTALATLVSAIAIACGIPLDISVSIAIVTALLRLGVEVINLMDRGMGIYTKAYFVEVNGMFITSFGYIWSQTINGNEADAPENNVAPSVPTKPYGEATGKLGLEYIFSTSSVDENGDDITYIFDWGDGNYSCTNLNESGKTVSVTHSWEEEGSYSICIKALDKYGFESDWSESHTIAISKSRQRSSFSLFDLLEKIVNRFYLLEKLLNIQLI